MRAHFASICLLAVAAANLVPRTDFKMANTQPAKSAKNGLEAASPNYIRGFYEQYDPENDFRARDHQAYNQAVPGQHQPTANGYGNHYIPHQVDVPFPTEALHSYGHDHRPVHMHFTILPPHLHETIEDYHPHDVVRETHSIPVPYNVPEHHYHHREYSYVPDHIEQPNMYPVEDLVEPTGFLDMDELYEYEPAPRHHSKHGYVHEEPKYTGKAPH